jgi:myo-inositol 2-dehydrogenase / D-chiro-inositol 1-dehydrogenase
MNKVRLGIIGTGGIAQAHIRRLRELPEAEIVAVCDVDEERVRVVGEPLGAAVYTDGARLIAAEKLDALYICVPPHAHGDLEVLAARKSLHLFVEKPVTLDMDYAREVCRVVEETGVMTQVGYTLRYLPVFLRLRELLADKEAGTAHVFRWGGLPASPWWRRYDQSGGQLVEMTTHQVDMLRWVLGEVEAVSAAYSFNRLLRDQPGVTVPDSQAVLLRFASGTSATINTSCAIGKAGHGGMDFALRDARVSVRGEEIHVEPEGSYPVPPPPAEAPGIDESFIRAVATGDRTLLRSPYADGVRTLAVTLAANRSAEEGGRLVPIAELIHVECDSLLSHPYPAG